MNDVFREEKKFLLGLTQRLKLDSYISQIMMQDAHNGTWGYPIRSLYFDTYLDDDYYEKLDGLETRRKIRLRCYDAKSDFAMLEMKQKQGVKQRKRSLRLPKEHVLKLINADYNVLLEYDDPFAAECYGLMNARCYRPKTIVEYNRKAFIAKENKIRVTFDSNIVSTESSFNLFDENLNMNYVLDPSLCVLEVKFNGFLLSYIKDALNMVEKSELSVSKYCLARQNGYQSNL